MKVTVYQDGRCLGLAFESPRQDPAEGGRTMSREAGDAVHLYVSRAQPPWTGYTCEGRHLSFCHSSQALHGISRKAHPRSLTEKLWKTKQKIERPCVEHHAEHDPAYSLIESSPKALPAGCLSANLSSGTGQGSSPASSCKVNRLLVW